MRHNGPVTQCERQLAAGEMLISTTDLKGRIQYCNRAFQQASGYDEEELIGQPHNMIRHPDTPAEAFRDLWATLHRGVPWRSPVKNRCKNGDHYWVEANVTPLYRQGQVTGFLSVRRPLTAAQVRESEALFARMREDAASPRPRLQMHSGRVTAKRSFAALTRRLHPGLVRMAYLVPLGLVALAACVSFLPVDPVTGAVLQLLVPSLVALMVGHWINAKVIRPALKATHVAARIAGGDLSMRVEDGNDGILGALLRTLDQLAFNLTGTVGDVRHMADEVSQVSQSIAASGSDIADRTVSQAASLEQTSAAMEQMTRTISDNAEGARLVDELAHRVQSTAEMGSAAVSDVVATMNKIHESSSRIEDILKVINSLSFQTNILSLNAAVEAARAGDMGRGFSVVASEVRNLAQQSSKSAQEIRALIQASSQAVGAGITNVQTARDRIGELVGSVDEVTTAVARISRASEEQADGAQQIREAVASLDTATQDTAARADESMSSTLELQQHSSRLLKAVGLFS